MVSFNKVKFLLILLIGLGLFMSLSQIAWAQDSILPPCTSTGDCSLCDIIQTAINAGKVILGIIGSLVLLMFVYGGFTWLISGGNEANIKKGKDILTNAVIGLAIIFSAYLIVTTLVTVLAKKDFDWQGNLACTAVNFAPAPIVNAVNLTAAVPKGNNRTENQACDTSANCGGCPATAKCYCQKPAAGAKEGKCVKAVEDGKPCKSDQIPPEKNDVTCQSQNCESNICKKGGGTCKNDGDCGGCKDPTKPTGEYCTKDKKCAPKLEAGKPCKPDIVGAKCTPGQACKSGTCKSDNTCQ